MLIDRGGDWKKKVTMIHPQIKTRQRIILLSKYIPFILDIPTNNIHRIGVGGGRRSRI